MQPQPLHNIPISPWEPGIFSLVLYWALVMLIMAAFFFLAAFLGEKKPGPVKETPYECGIEPTGSARFRYPAPFYLVAVFFLIFDVEGAFIFAWAAAFQSLGWKGWLAITFFIFVLLLGLGYIWTKGALDWERKTDN